MPTSFTVTTEADLNAALAQIDLTRPSSAANTAYTSGFTLASDLDAINLASGNTLAINGGGFTVDGAGTYRGLSDHARAAGGQQSRDQPHHNWGRQ